MKRLMILLSAVLVLAIALLLQMDLIALFRLSLAGIYDAPTTMYFLWIFPTLFNIDYEILQGALLLIVLISDLFLLGAAYLVYLGLTIDVTPTYRKYHF